MADDALVTTMYQIGLTWYQGLSNGGTPVIDYTIWYQFDTNPYAIFESGVTQTSYVATSLTTGTVYKFKVQARNAFGLSEFSDEVAILAASKPSRPSQPTTTLSDLDDEVTVTWTEPATNGAPVESYSIYIRHSDFLSYSLLLDSCDGSDPTIVSEKSCKIPVSYLIVAPFELPWGSSVFAKVLATNSKGSSTLSNGGNGAIIVTYPDPPINVSEVLSVKTPTTLGISWTQDPFNGGAVVQDYRVSIAVQGEAFSVLETGLTVTTATAYGLTAGVTYEFKV